MNGAWWRRLDIATAWGDVWRWGLFAAGAALATYFLLGRGLLGNAVTAFGVAFLVVAVSLTPRLPMALPLMAMPVLFVTARLGGGGASLTVSDAALAAAFGVVALFGERPLTREMRAILLLNGIYQFATLLTVIANPFLQNTVEWVHAWMLVSGALVVGWGVGAAGYARLALRLMVGAALALAAITIVDGVLHYIHGDFSPVFPHWPYPMNKNFVGTTVAFAALIVYVNPVWAEFGKPARRTILTVLGIALLFTQSRQAIIGLMIAILLVVSRRRVHGHSRAVFFLVIPAAFLVITMVRDQIASQNKFNSVFQRLNWLKEVYAYFKHDPFFGHGLRYWYVDPTMNYQPPQGEVEVLASSGLVGLAAFIVMWIGIIVVLWRMDPAYGTLAATAVISRLVQAQFDLFWVSAQVSIPFVIAGVCLGAKAYADRHPPAEPTAAAIADGLRPGVTRSA